VRLREAHAASATRAEAARAPHAHAQRPRSSWRNRLAGAGDRVRAGTSWLPKRARDALASIPDLRPKFVRDYFDCGVKDSRDLSKRETQRRKREG